MKKQAHVISHSHWDREWYLPYEKHHMLEVEFMDRLLDTLERDPEFKSFHLDGQTIMLDDYLQVRPERRELVEKLVKDKRLYIGPWYILQDEWLTGSESNLRNLETGMREAKGYGNVSRVGYFPDSFGNMGQAPQILLDAGIDCAAFGRGVKPTGFNNEVSDGADFASQYSEMFWESPDGSRILGVLFANWYSNGIEVPSDPQEAQEYWEKKLADAIKFASTDHLLFMNGCDHQPVQTDLTDALRTAAKLYPEVDFVHSNFTEYMECLKQELKEDLAVIKGELRSQETDGWYTLANTASARIYLKQSNARCEALFARAAEPLAAMAHDRGMEYPHHLLDYGWKTLMQNHPHDSICGCSVDEVHREMAARFEKAEQVALHIIGECLDYFAAHVDTGKYDEKEGAVPFLVVNPTGFRKSEVTALELIVKKYPFQGSTVAACLEQAKQEKLPRYRIVDSEGNEVMGSVEELPYAFGYDLPKDRFRKAYFGRSVKVTLETVRQEPFSIKSYCLVPIEEQEAEKGAEEKSLFTSEYVMENEWLSCRVNENGTVDITHKPSGRIYREAVMLEDTRDIGNEYIYFKPVGEAPILSKNARAVLKRTEDKPYRAAVQAQLTMEIPVSADERLQQEIHDLVEFRYRKAGSSTQTIPMTVTVTYILERAGKGLHVEVDFDNQALDHRLRVLIGTGLNTPWHYADSIFEVAKRSNGVSESWENPCNAQHQQLFVNVHEEQAGMTAANHGLNEYEVLPEYRPEGIPADMAESLPAGNTIALTLHRGVREMGDWGDFPTPQAQCLGKQHKEFALFPHGAGEDLMCSYEEAYAYSSSLWGVKSERKDTSIPDGFTFLKYSTDTLLWTALKVQEETGDVIFRAFNTSEREGELTLETDRRIYRSNVLGEKKEYLESGKISVRGYGIVTAGLEKKDAGK